MWHSHFIIIEMLKTKLFKPNSVYFSNWIFSVTLTTRVEKPPKLERLQNKIPDIKFDFLLLDFVRNKCSRIQGTYTRTGTRTDQGTVCLFLQIRTFFKENLWCVNGQILIGKKFSCPWTVSPDRQSHPHPHFTSAMHWNCPRILSRISKIRTNKSISTNGHQNCWNIQSP